MKYKAWHKKWNKWIHDELDIFINPDGEVIEYYHHGYEIANRDISKDVDIVIFTGLKDKNGNEIFEGDIVSARLKSNTAGFTGCVYYLNAQYWVNYIGYESYYQSLMCLHGAEYEPIEIIGNIYENPKLLSNPTSDSITLTK